MDEVNNDKRDPEKLYKILQKVGQGNYGSVYKIQDIKQAKFSQLKYAR